MEDEKTLKSIALVRHLTNTVKRQVYALLSCKRNKLQIPPCLLILKKAGNFNNAGKIM
jgi:hypothetical protein